jgi:hypothetical protein
LTLVHVPNSICRQVFAQICTEVILYNRIIIFALIQKHKTILYLLDVGSLMPSIKFLRNRKTFYCVIYVIEQYFILQVCKCIISYTWNDKLMYLLAEQSNGVMGTGCALTAIIITMPREPIAIGNFHVSYFCYNCIGTSYFCQKILLFPSIDWFQ